MKRWIVTHRRRHNDEFVGELQLRLLMSGMAQAELVEVGNPDDITAEKLREAGVELPAELAGAVSWQELEKHGVYLLGIGGSDLDEHGRGEYTCAAELVMKKVGVLLGFSKQLGQAFIAALHDLVRYTRWADRNRGVGSRELPNMVKKRWRVWEGLCRRTLQLPAVLMPKLETLPKTMADVARLVAHATFQDLFVDLADSIGFYTCMLNMVAKNQIQWDEFKIPGTQITLKLAIISAKQPDADNSYAPVVARKLGAHLVFKRTSKGHVGLWTTDNIRVTLSDGTEVTINLDVRRIVVELRKRELKRNDDKRALTGEQLAAETVQGCITYLIPGSGTILWGSDQSSQDVEACPLGDSVWISAIKRFIQILDVQVTLKLSGKTGEFVIMVSLQTFVGLEDPTIQIFKEHVALLSEALQKAGRLTATVGEHTKGRAKDSPPSANTGGKALIAEDVVMAAPDKSGSVPVASF